MHWASINIISSQDIFWSFELELETGEWKVPVHPASLWFKVENLWFGSFNLAAQCKVRVYIACSHKNVKKAEMLNWRRHSIPQTNRCEVAKVRMHEYLCDYGDDLKRHEYYLLNDFLREIENVYLHQRDSCWNWNSVGKDNFQEWRRQVIVWIVLNSRDHVTTNPNISVLRAVRELVDISWSVFVTDAFGMHHFLMLLGCTI